MKHFNIVIFIFYHLFESLTPTLHELLIFNIIYRLSFLQTPKQTIVEKILERYYTNFLTCLTKK